MPVCQAESFSREKADGKLGKGDMIEFRRMWRRRPDAGPLYLDSRAHIANPEFHSYISFAGEHISWEFLKAGDSSISLSLPGSLWSFCHSTGAVRSKSERAGRERKSHTQISTPIRALKTSQTIPGTRLSSTPLYISFIVLRLHKIHGTGFAGCTVYYKMVWE